MTVEQTLMAQYQFVKKGFDIHEWDNLPKWVRYAWYEAAKAEQRWDELKEPS